MHGRVLVAGFRGVVALVQVGVLVEDGEEDPHIFHPGVHALAVEGHHGVGRVADDDAGRAVVIGFALDADERKVRIAVEGGDEVGSRNEIGYAGEMCVEEGGKGGGIGFQEAELLA